MSISSISFVLFFVQDPLKSAAFYRRLLGIEPVESSPTFVLFALGQGSRLGLWSRTTARPPVKAEGGSCEICFSKESTAQVEALYTQWKQMGVIMAQEPIAMDGMSRTFVALDPDGHRIRVLALEEEAQHV